MRTRPHFSTLLAVVALTLAWGAASPAWAQNTEQATAAKLAAEAATLEAEAATLAKHTFKRKNGESLTFEEFIKLPTSTRREIANELTGDEAIKYKEWRAKRSAALDKSLEAIEAKTAEIAKQTAAIEADNAEKSKQLLIRYEQYVGNMERGAGGEKKVLQQILAQDFVPDALKQRIRSLMAHPATRWRD